MVQRLAAAGVIAGLAGVLALTAEDSAGGAPVKIVALGDSLVAGYGLPANAAFPVQLEKALNAKDVAVEIANAGVSGDTSSGGLGRLDWSVPDGTDAVIVTLGANDMLRGLDPKVTRDALTQIVQKLKARKIEVLLTGMQAAPNMGPDYARAFNTIYPDIAKAEGVLLYPFYLDGVAGDAKLNQRDGIHPTEAGVAAIVQRVLPVAGELVARVKARRGS